MDSIIVFSNPYSVQIILLSLVIHLKRIQQDSISSVVINLSVIIRGQVLIIDLKNLPEIFLGLGIVCGDLLVRLRRLVVPAQLVKHLAKPAKRHIGRFEVGMFRQ